MSNSFYIRSAKAQAALEYSPPLIRSTLLEDNNFKKEYGFSLVTNISFGDSGIVFTRSVLFDSIRDVLSGNSEPSVVDVNGRMWEMKFETNDNSLPIIVIHNDSQRFQLPDFSVLSPHAATRLASLDISANEVNLPDQAKTIWGDILSNRPLEDDEVDEFHQDIRDTPVHVEKIIANEIRAGKSNVWSLVPSSRRYYDRLIGPYDGSKTIDEYADSVTKEFVSKLLKWNQKGGLLFSLLMSSHSSLTSMINISELSVENIYNAYEFLDQKGDRVSQLGAIEIGLRVLPSMQELAPYIVKLTKRIRDDDVDSLSQGIKLFSALYILVDGELSGLRIMSETPPFYRRLAALSQAALIQRKLVDSIADDTFYKWAMNRGGDQFYWQALSDMRFEPRWNPDLVSANQIKADFFGRMMVAASRYSENIVDFEIKELILSDGDGSIQSLSEFPMPFFPGPLEGGIECPNSLPDGLSKAIEEQLKTDEVTPDNFTALVNSSLLFRLEGNQVELAEKALELGNYRLSKVSDKTQFMLVLTGLAKVSASCRSVTLAEKLRILVRRYMHDQQYKLSATDALGIAVTASACTEDPVKWRDFLGEWICELSFSELSKNEAESLYSSLHYLLHAAPILWVSCAKAEAALKGYIDS